MTIKKNILGLVVALPAEAGAILGRGGWTRKNGWRVRYGTVNAELNLICVCSGVGFENAYGAALWLVRSGATSLSVMGISGGLNPALKPGDIIVAQSIIEQRNNRHQLQWATDPTGVDRFPADAVRNDNSVYSGAILTTEKPVLTIPEKSSCFAATGAQAVDMESAAVARAAAEADLSLFALRTICDGASDDVCETQFNLLKADGTIRWSKVVITLLCRPYRIPHLIRRGRQYAEALSSLKRGWQLQVERMRR